MPLSRASEVFTLWEFAAIVVNLPRESATWRKMHGNDRAEWDISAQLLAEVANSVRWLQWAQTKEGQRNQDRPERILPPWVEDENRAVSVFGSDPVPINELDEFLGWGARAA